MPQCEFCGKSKRGMNAVYFLKVEKLRRFDDDSDRWYAEIFDGVHVPTKVTHYHAKLRPARGLVRCRACHDKHVAMFSAMHDFVPATKPARTKNVRLKPNLKRPPSTDSDGMALSVEGSLGSRPDT